MYVKVVKKEQEIDTKKGGGMEETGNGGVREGGWREQRGEGKRKIDGWKMKELRQEETAWVGEASRRIYMASKRNKR